MSNNVTSYRDLVVWQKAMDLVDVIYSLTEAFPKLEQYRLIDQMIRSAISIPSNIAEGSRRSSRKDYRYFLIVAYSSGAELETQIEVSQRRQYGDIVVRSKAKHLLDEVMRMLNRMIKNLKR